MIVRRNKKPGRGCSLSEKKNEARRALNRKQFESFWNVSWLHYFTIRLQCIFTQMNSTKFQIHVNICVCVSNKKKNIFGNVVGFSDQCTQECLHKHKLTARSHTCTVNKARNVSMDQSNNTKSSHRTHLAHTRTAQKRR